MISVFGSFILGIALLVGVSSIASRLAGASWWTGLPCYLAFLMVNDAMPELGVLSQTMGLVSSVMAYGVAAKLIGMDVWQACIATLVFFGTLSTVHLISEARLV